MQVYEGELISHGARFCLVVARFNEHVVERLETGAVDTLRRHGVAADAIDVVRVPGAFEIPLAAQHAARTGRYDALVVLGAVIRGATPHFDLVANACSSGVARVSLDERLPVGFGVLTCDTIEQAVERAGSKAGNKGAEAALAALEMVDVLRRLGSSE